METMKNKLINVFDEKITNAILNSIQIVIQTEVEKEVCCRNLINIDYYEKDETHISLGDKQYELHFYINNSTEIDYDEIENSFHIKNKYTDIFISFLD